MLRSRKRASKLRYIDNKKKLHSRHVVISCVDVKASALFSLDNERPEQRVYTLMLAPERICVARQPFSSTDKLAGLNKLQ